MRQHIISPAASDYGVLEAFINKSRSLRHSDARRIKRTLRQLAR